MWPFKSRRKREAGIENPGWIVWEAQTLAKLAIFPLVDHFPQYQSIIDSDLSDLWVLLLSVSMIGVGSEAHGYLRDSPNIKQLERALQDGIPGSLLTFEEWQAYANLAKKETNVHWSGVSAMWVSIVLRSHKKASEALMKAAGQIDFVNPMSSFINMSFGSVDGGFPHFLETTTLQIETDNGINMGLGTKGTRNDSDVKVQLLAAIFHQWASNCAKMISEHAE